MSHPRLHNPVKNANVLEALADAADIVSSVAIGDFDSGTREIVYRFLEDLPDGWTIEELMRKLEGW